MFLFALAIVVASIYILRFKSLCKELEPSLFLVAEDVLPITVKDGKVVEPENTYKNLDWNFSQNKSLKVVLDTKVDVINDKDEYGIYISKDGLFISIYNDIKKIELSDGMFDFEKFKEWYKVFMGAVGVYSSIVVILVSFFSALFKVFGIWGCCFINKKFAKDKILLSNEQIMRLSSVWVAGVEAVLILFNVLFGVGLNEFFVYIILVIIVMRSAKLIFRDMDLQNN